MGLLNPNEILRELSNIGTARAEFRLSKLIVLSILAGAFIAFAAFASGMGAYNLLANEKTYGLGRLVAALIFTGGLSMVVVGGAELFTGNTLMTIPLMQRRISIKSVIRNWIIVYCGNLIGSLIVVFIVVNSGLMNVSEGMLGLVSVNIAVKKTGLSFTSAMVMGIGCNWLVCMAVWMSTAAKEVVSKIVAVFFPIMMFATAGFEHSVANMFYIPLGIFAKTCVTGEIFILSDIDVGNLSWQTFFVNNLIPVTIGNIIGGVVFVAFAYFIAYNKDNK